ncbi:protoporphyrinogen oxidase [Sulfitobacter sp. JL08]|uniref:flavodoxin domain-containing protein n=1 Tax=Sulfitobacter sp. JL08 TaxID=2070369 RepID=UPI000E0B1617|nr:flavodoxin domain-containing protein [Sulfitobacter sp. JL08]AXI55390.1 protoporphyrinogen oxidase [Sulfitobacter sp. JL08]
MTHSDARKILIVYASTEGQTRKIARYCADRLMAMGHSVEMLRAADDDGGTLGQADAVILAGSVHMGRLQKELADLDRIAAEFCDKAGLRPLSIHQVAGAFRFTQYDFFKSWAMRYIAAKMDQDVDPHADREYTDWAKLADIVKDFVSFKGRSADAKAPETVRPQASS